MSRTRTVLLVEDDPDLRDAIEQLLHCHGYHVVATGNGLRAVELAVRNKVDVALVDLLIPGQSGFKVTSELKSLYRDEIRIVLMSGIASPAQQAYAFAAGAEHFLPKPFTASQLLDTVASYCPPPPEPVSEIRRTARIGQ